MRDLLHPVLLGLLVTAIGVIAHRGGRAAAKHAGQVQTDEDADPKETPQEANVAKDAIGKEARREHVGEGAAEEGAPAKDGMARRETAKDAIDGNPLIAGLGAIPSPTSRIGSNSAPESRERTRSDPAPPDRPGHG